MRYDMPGFFCALTALPYGHMLVFSNEDAFFVPALALRAAGAFALPYGGLCKATSIVIIVALGAAVG